MASSGSYLPATLSLLVIEPASTISPGEVSLSLRAFTKEARSSPSSPKYTAQPRFEFGLDEVLVPDTAVDGLDFRLDVLFGEAILGP
jgi:hypothetical protein